MSRMLLALTWMLASLWLCSCSPEPESPPSDAAVQVPAAHTDSPAEPQPSPPRVADTPEPRPVAEADESGPLLKPRPAAEPPAEAEPGVVTQTLPAEPAAGSGNPLVDFFRAVDRGVKSTTPDANQPQPPPSGAAEPDGQ